MLVVATVLTMSLFEPLAPTAAAESLNDTNTNLPGSLELAQTPEKFVPGIPSSTSPPDMKTIGAKLTWTPTGNETLQDTYNVRVSLTTETDHRELVSPLYQANQLQTAEYVFGPEITDGTYYWQVQSCDQIGICTNWSDVWSLVLDAVAPSAPVAFIASDSYDTAVAVAGSSEPLSVLRVTASGYTCTTTANSKGDWSCSFKQDFEYGDYEASIVAIDKVGNESESARLTFSINELFVAENIKREELPAVLDIVPADESLENKVSLQPAKSQVDRFEENRGDAGQTAPSTSPLSTEGGIIQSSEDGWQVLGLPWFMWLGSAAGLTGGWWLFGLPGARRLGSVLSL